MQTFSDLSPTYHKHCNPHSCLTIQVENMHATVHFKSVLMTMLEYVKNLYNLSWSTYCITGRNYFLVPGTIVPHMGYLAPEHLKSMEAVFP